MATNGKSQKGLREKLGKLKTKYDIIGDALGALNIPSAADIERLTRRVRSVSQRLEGIEDGVDRLDRVFSPHSVEQRLATIERQLESIGDRLGDMTKRGAAAVRASATRHTEADESAPKKAPKEKPAKIRANAKKPAKKPAKAAAKKPAAKKTPGR